MDDSGFDIDPEEALEPLEFHEEPLDGNIVDVAKLPRSDLNEFFREGYVPVAVGTDSEREYIVVAPSGGAAEDLDTSAPHANWEETQRIFAERERYGSLLVDHNGMVDLYNPSESEILAERRRRAGVPRSNIRNPRHLPLPAPLHQQGLPSEPDENMRVGIGTDGEIRQHRRTIIEHGVGVAGDEGGMTELGSAVASPWTAWTRREYNADLVGYKGLRVYDKMRKSDGTVRGTLRLAKTPVLGAQWGMRAASDRGRDQRIRDFVWNSLVNWQSMSWPQFLTEALLMLDFGYYMFEKVFARGEDITDNPAARDKIVWKKLAPRHPMDVKQWFFDINGGPLSVDMWAPPSEGVSTFEGGTIQVMQRWINIPINKLLVFTYDKEAGNIEGISLLRTAYKHWFYKDNLYKIDAIQKERHGIGVPVIRLPVGYNQNDLKKADQLGRNLRTNDRAHVVLPPTWELTFAELKGHPVDCMTSIKHHDQAIPAVILGQFMTREQTSVEEQHTIFLKAQRFTADIVMDVVNQYAVPQLVKFNWQRAVFPSLYAKRIGEQEDWRTNSFTLRNYVGAGIIVPDQRMEDQIRDEMGLPEVDMTTARVVRTPAQENVQKVQPAPTELPGPGHGVVPAQIPGEPPTPHIPSGAWPTYPSIPPGGETDVNPAPQRKTEVPAPAATQLPSGPAAPQLPRVGPPRQTRPGVVPPSVGRGDRSGKSKRRGQ